VAPRRWTVDEFVGVIDAPTFGAGIVIVASGRREVTPAQQLSAVFVCIFGGRPRGRGDGVAPQHAA
jgi:hypothetical protein